MTSTSKTPMNTVVNEEPQVQRKLFSGDWFRHEFNELCCKPRARCFKGFTILFSIYSLACLLLLAFIPPVIDAHGVTYEEE